MNALDYYIDLDGTMTEQARYEVTQGLTILSAAVSRTAHRHGWWSDRLGDYQARNMGEMLMLMTSELAEALESHRRSEPVLWYKHRDDHDKDWTQLREVDGELGKPEGIAAELADCIIRILDTCQTLDIPIVQALLEKHAYNITRPYRHGGKTC